MVKHPNVWSIKHKTFRCLVLGGQGAIKACECHKVTTGPATGIFGFNQVTQEKQPRICGLTHFFSSLEKCEFDPHSRRLKKKVALKLLDLQWLDGILRNYKYLTL